MKAARTKPPRPAPKRRGSDLLVPASSSVLAWNAELFERINASAAAPHWRVAVAIAIAQWVIWLVPAWLTLSWFRSDAQGRRELLEVLAVMLLALGLGQVIAALWPQPRPFMVHLGSQLLAHAPDPGFPSDHVTVFWSAAASAALATRRSARIGLLWFALGLLVGWSRVFLGVHFPLDVLGALPVAALATLSVRALRQPMQPIYTGLLQLWSRVSGRSQQT
jgi:undecaprenyl-diphosphatase